MSAPFIASIVEKAASEERDHVTKPDAPESELILYQTEDGRTRIQCRFEDETVWLTQKLMADLFQIGGGTVNHHLKAIFAEGELDPKATVRRYRIVQTEGPRRIGRDVEHYNLAPVIERNEIAPAPTIRRLRIVESLPGGV